MPTIGRNEPCPCGSGAKYKKCCLPRDEARQLEQRAAVAAPVAPAWVLEDDGLDELSSSVVDLVHAGRLDDALAAAQRLLAEFPDVVDGLERCATVYAARGDHAIAADFYRRALAFVTDPTRRDDYEGVADFYRAQAEAEERLAGRR